MLAPFRGVRYAGDRVSGIANVTSPPYDVISTGILDDLLAADPHNVVRLILPGAGHSEAGGGREHGEGEGGPGPGHGQLAAFRLRDWLSSGVLVRDPLPALYVYEQSGDEGGGWLQRGLIGLVRVGSPDAAGILPHEDVIPGPVEGRRELMAATRANLEPIFLVYDGEPGATGPTGADPGATGPAGAGSAAAGPAGAGSAAAGPGTQATAAQIVDRVAAEAPPLVSAVTRDGIMHRLWQLTDPAEHAAIAADLAGRHAMIADGHHRYAAYRELRDEMCRAGRGAGSWDYGLAFLVDSAAYPPRLGAIHRVLPGLPPERAAELAKTAFTVRELYDAADVGDAGGVGGVGDLGAALSELAEAGRDGTAFLLTGDAGFRLLSNPDPEQLADAMPAGTSPRWQDLDASVLQELLLARVWGIADNEQDVLIFHDPAEAARVASALGGTAVIVNPISFAAVRDIAAHGERVPRKSTSFGPKPRTGFVFRTFED
jgi:uncharacterized protein (DUF1015 family)